MPCANATVAAVGCQQRAAGNWWLRINVSCSEYGFDDTLVLELRAYVPLPGSPDQPIVRRDGGGRAGTPAPAAALPRLTCCAALASPPPRAPQAGLFVLSQPEVPDDFDYLQVPGSWDALPDPAAIFAALPWEQPAAAPPAPGPAALLPAAPGALPADGSAGDGGTDAAAGAGLPDAKDHPGPAGGSSAQGPAVGPEGALTALATEAGRRRLTERRRGKI